MEEKLYDRQVPPGRHESHFNPAEFVYKILERPIPLIPDDDLLAKLYIKLKDLILTFYKNVNFLEMSRYLKAKRKKGRKYIRSNFEKMNIPNITVKNEEDEGVRVYGNEVSSLEKGLEPSAGKDVKRS
ncbi:hypothetical protein DAPPUDRAFT_112577 [Daphnia pulex]|uniref:Uncharacterized protein n=1 Tax=Daphnia pulex TaxID=6669 RepID=E9HCJ1_DAPPU|nr:hypothetical protein DAPPUDRAFT_112577 [Daphnia pulex]|eukprot:EFX70569.1 hypothetical protein DAPPUDRAFT_112577 [Daphnia pulex]